MAGRPPDPERRKARQETVLDAAMQLFATKGVHQTTMKDICEAAAISPGALYRYFASKDDIILALAQLDAQDLGQLADAIEGEADLIDTLTRWAETIITWQTDDLLARLRIEFTAEALRNPLVAEAFRAADERLGAALEAALRRDIAAGLLPESHDATSMSYLIHALIDGIAGRAACNPGANRRDLVASLQGLFMSLRIAS
ncbi:TetR/AcrR family transcriptional regulator [Paracoccus sp. NSM]|uniref:TetR/AcrR family transcriptional regulator n=1 Tax=Paracoccus sp. NSM TaxID=3457784 RepID=UPI004036D694